MSMRPSAIRAACRSVNVNLYDFLRLHGSHSSAKFDIDSFPFNFLGFLWSTCMKSKYGGTYPHPRHRSPSRFANASLALRYRYPPLLGLRGFQEQLGGRRLPVVRSLWSRRRSPDDGIPCHARGDLALQAFADHPPPDSSSMSMPIHCRPSCSAATHVVAQPANGSSTMSPGLEDASIMRAYNANGFCVG